MGVKPKFSLSELKADIARRGQLVQRVMENRMAEQGEITVNDARTVYTYQDQTGNLTSSKGYVLASDRGVIGENFKTTQSTANEGEQKARNLARTGVAGFSGGILLKVVAGMNYASTVESRGYDVLTSATLKLEQRMPSVIQKIRADIKNVK